MTFKFIGGGELGHLEKISSELRPNPTSLAKKIFLALISYEVCLWFVSSTPFLHGFEVLNKEVIFLRFWQELWTVKQNPLPLSVQTLLFMCCPHCSQRSLLSKKEQSMVKSTNKKQLLLLSEVSKSIDSQFLPIFFSDAETSSVDGPFCSTRLGSLS